MYYKAKNVDTDKALKAITEARRTQKIRIDKEIAEKRAYGLKDGYCIVGW